MGAGTNVQDRLVASMTWIALAAGRPCSAKGRIERQGNQKPGPCVPLCDGRDIRRLFVADGGEQAEIYFANYDQQSPVRSCDDVDETALSFAEIRPCAPETLVSRSAWTWMWRFPS